MDMDMSMSMGSSSMTMSSMAMSTDMPSSTGMSMPMSTGMGGMSSSMMDMGDCKVSMLWNCTIDACFLAESWHITSRGMFAGTCFAVVALVLALEFLRRLQRDFERAYEAHAAKAHADAHDARLPQGSIDEAVLSHKFEIAPKSDSTATLPRQRRPAYLAQATRSTLYALQFALAYIIMLIVMSFNGYVVISIFVGAWIGSFLFGWDQLLLRPQPSAPALV